MPPLPPPRPLSMAASRPEATRAQRRKRHPRSQPARPPPWAAGNLHAAGIDVGAEAHAVAGPPSDDPQSVRRGGASTVDVECWADWGAACGLTPVALESTGVSGSPRGARVETRGVEVLRVEPPPGQPIKGRPPRDGHDGQWRPRRPPVGLLAGACRPPAHGCVLRSALRLRALVLTAAKGPDADAPHAAARHPRGDGGDREGAHTGHARWGTRPWAVGAPPACSWPPRRGDQRPGAPRPGARRAPRGRGPGGGPR
jgi:hypothetical protein